MAYCLKITKKGDARYAQIVETFYDPIAKRSNSRSVESFGDLNKQLALDPAFEDKLRLRIHMLNQDDSLSSQRKHERVNSDPNASALADAATTSLGSAYSDSSLSVAATLPNAASSAFTFSHFAGRSASSLAKKPELKDGITPITYGLAIERALWEEFDLHNLLNRLSENEPQTFNSDLDLIAFFLMELKFNPLGFSVRPAEYRHHTIVDFARVSPEELAGGMVFLGKRKNTILRQIRNQFIKFDLSARAMAQKDQIQDSAEASAWNIPIPDVASSPAFDATETKLAEPISSAQTQQAETYPESGIQCAKSDSFTAINSADATTAVDTASSTPSDPAVAATAQAVSPHIDLKPASNLVRVLNATLHSDANAADLEASLEVESKTVASALAKDLTLPPLSSNLATASATAKQHDEPDATNSMSPSLASALSTSLTSALSKALAAQDEGASDFKEDVSSYAEVNAACKLDASAPHVPADMAQALAQAVAATANQKARKSLDEVKNELTNAKLEPFALSSIRPFIGSTGFYDVRSIYLEAPKSQRVKQQQLVIGVFMTCDGIPLDYEYLYQGKANYFKASANLKRMVTSLNDFCKEFNWKRIIIRVDHTYNITQMLLALTELKYEYILCLSADVLPFSIRNQIMTATTWQRFKVKPTLADNLTKLSAEYATTPYSAGQYTSMVSRQVNNANYSSLIACSKAVTCTALYATSTPNDEAEVADATKSNVLDTEMSDSNVSDESSSKAASATPASLLTAAKSELRTAELNRNANAIKDTDACAQLEHERYESAFSVLDTSSDFSNLEDVEHPLEIEDELERDNPALSELSLQERLAHEHSLAPDYKYQLFKLSIKGHELAPVAIALWSQKRTNAERHMWALSQSMRFDHINIAGYSDRHVLEQRTGAFLNLLGNYNAAAPIDFALYNRFVQTLEQGGELEEAELQLMQQIQSNFLSGTIVFVSSQTLDPQKTISLIKNLSDWECIILQFYSKVLTPWDWNKFVQFSDNPTKFPTVDFIHYQGQIAVSFLAWMIEQWRSFRLHNLNLQCTEQALQRSLDLLSLVRWNIGRDNCWLKLNTERIERPEVSCQELQRVFSHFDIALPALHEKDESLARKLKLNLPLTLL